MWVVGQDGVVKGYDSGEWEKEKPEKGSSGCGGSCSIDWMEGDSETQAERPMPSRWDRSGSAQEVVLLCLLAILTRVDQQ